MAKMQLPTNYSKHTSNNPLRRLLLQKFNQQLIKNLHSLHPISILDAGCGEGFSLAMLKKNHIGEKLEGIDFSEDALILGRQQFPDLHLKQASIYKLPYKNNTFDMVLCTEVLEHLENPKSALDELMRVSSRYVVLSVPNEPFFMFSRLITGHNILQFGNHPEHINHWSPRTLTNLLTSYNVKIKKIEVPFPWILVVLEKRRDN